MGLTSGRGRRILEHMTTTYTTQPATIRLRRREVLARTVYDIVADIHETGEVIALDPTSRPGVAMDRAGIKPGGEFTADPQANGWMMTEGLVWRTA